MIEKRHSPHHCRQTLESGPRSTQTPAPSFTPAKKAPHDQPRIGSCKARIGVADGVGLNDSAGEYRLGLGFSVRFSAPA